MKKFLPQLNSAFLVKLRTASLLPLVGILLIGVASMAIAARVYFLQWQAERQQLIGDQGRVTTARDRLTSELDLVTAQLSSASAELETLKTEDQRTKNSQPQADIKSIETTFSQALLAYEDLLELRGDAAKTQKLESQFSLVLTQLSKRNYASGSATLRTLNQDIATLRAQLATAAAPIPSNVPSSNTAPAAGYSRQVVESDAGSFMVDILGADLGSTRVQVETASEGDCRDGCPVASLSDFVSRSGGFAGINGPYFCPAEYPSCAGKTNSFDTLLMNKKKVYFNSDNNVYSSVPAMIFSGGGARLVGQSSEWGRDTGVDAVIAGQPMLLSGGNVTFGGDGDPKKGSRGSRSFIASKDNSVYIGVVRGATVAETARVLKALGMQSALNLDSGGSTAFMVNGKYLAGPGRATPFGIVLVRK